MATVGGILGVIRASRPLFRFPHDCVAFAVQSAFLSAGYSLLAAGSRAASHIPEGQENEEVGIEGWNDMEDAYAFLYSGAGQEGLCKSLLVKCVSIGDTLMVDAAPVGGGDDKEPLHAEIKSSDYVSTSEGTNYGQVYKNLPELVQQMNSRLLSKLSATDSTSTSNRHEDSKAFGEENLEKADLHSHDPHIMERVPPTMPGMVYPHVVPVGTDDLLPGPGAGVFPNRVDPGFGGGMLVGPNDPRWRLGIGDDVSEEFLDGGRGVPPGARFDPYGPPGVPGFEPNGFTRYRRPGRGINPDLEHFQPF